MDAVDFASRAPQIVTPELVPPGGAVHSDADTRFDEDCLFLNICTPADKPASALPVIVWFHGGGFVWGSGANYIGDGAALTEEGVIVVTVNYRLGALGFLRLDHLLGDTYAASANCGLLDQIAALRWVQSNIAAFGGDPQRITIAGVSAGGKSVANLMAAPDAQGLFHHAIIQSGGEHVASPQTAAALTRALLDVLRIKPSDAATLLTLPAETLLEGQQQLASGARATWLWRPTVDGRILPRNPVAALASGQARGISLMAGTTSNEAGSYQAADPTAADQAPAVLQEIFKDAAGQVLNAYQSNRPNADQKSLHLDILSDERYGIPTLRLLDAQSTHASCWRYRFDAPSPGAPADKWGFHGADVPFVWNIGMEAADPESRKLATNIRSTWTSFISTGKPDAENLPFWPEYSPADRHTMRFDLPSRIESDPFSKERRAWDGAAWDAGTWWPII